jgi:hypothetical protein
LIILIIIRIGKSEKKDFLNNTVSSPGPIYYYENHIGKSSSKGFKFSNDEKLKMPINNIPGPGAYQNLKKISSAPKFS